MRMSTTSETRARTTTWRTLAAAILLAGLTGLSVGCKKEEGAMERAGKQLDDAAEKAGDTAGDAVEKAGDDIDKAADELGEKLRGGG